MREGGDVEGKDRGRDQIVERRRLCTSRVVRPAYRSQSRFDSDANRHCWQRKYTSSFISTMSRPQDDRNQEATVYLVSLLHIEFCVILAYRSFLG